jgi:hypothetical protein
LDALYAADIDYEFFDVETGRIEKPLLLYGGGRWLGKAGQRRLAEYVEQGGTLVFGQSLPLVDEALRPLNLLGLREPVGVTTAADPHRLRLELGEHALELSSPAVFAYADGPGEAIWAERAAPRPPGQQGGYRHVQLPVGERLAVGYHERRGRRRLVVLGVAPTPELLLALHAWLGIRVACRARGAGVHSALFRRGPDLFSVLTNTSAADQETTLDLDVAEYDRREARVLVPARAGTFLKLDAAERR